MMHCLLYHALCAVHVSSGNEKNHRCVLKKKKKGSGKKNHLEFNQVLKSVNCG